MMMVDAGRRRELVAGLRRQGIADERVLAAVEEVPRDLFVPTSFEDQSYADTALPIDCGQTISQPFVVATMTTLLDIGPRMKVLEVGTGSGYQAAVLARLCRRVYTIERFQKLLVQAEACFHQLDISNLTTRFGDGLKGWPEQAPFERILVTAATRIVPEALFAQLKEGGVMVLPLEDGHGGERLTRVVRQRDEMRVERLDAVRFVPLVAGTVSDEA